MDSLWLIKKKQIIGNPIEIFADISFLESTMNDKTVTGKNPNSGISTSEVLANGFGGGDDVCVSYLSMVQMQCLCCFDVQM